MKKGKKNRKKHLFSIWLGVWIPMFLVMVVLVGCGTGYACSVVSEEQYEFFQEFIKTLENDWKKLDSLAMQKYQEYLKDGKEKAQDFVLFSLQARANAFSLSDIYSVIYDENGDVVGETSKSVYIGLRKTETEDSEENNTKWYQCRNEKIVGQILEVYEKYVDDAYQGEVSYKFDDIYVKGTTFIPAKMIVLQGNTVKENVTLPLEDEELSSYEHIGNVLGNDIVSREGSEWMQMIGINGFTSEKWGQFWDEQYLNQLKEIKKEEILNFDPAKGFDTNSENINSISSPEDEEFTYFDWRKISFNQIEMRSCDKLNIDGTIYYMQLRKIYHPFTEIKNEVFFAFCAGLLFTIVFALIVAANFYRIYKKEIMLQKRQRDFSNALAHDLKTPLMAISGYTENLAENIHPEKKEHYIDGIQSNISYMNELIGQVLEMAKIENASSDIKKSEMPLEETVQKILDLYQEMTEEKQITISVTGSAHIMADAVLMERAMENLIKNALEYTPEHQSITIKMNQKQFEITNTGAEIEKDKIEEMWKPFNKGDESRYGKQGHGLGLSIVKNVLELHGFRYEMVSEKNQVTVRVLF